MKQHDVPWKVLGQPIGGVDYDCIGLAQGNTALRNWLNVALFALQSEGFIDTDYKKWFGIGMVPPITPQPVFIEPRRGGRIGSGRRPLSPMHYSLQFGQVWPHFFYLLAGAVVTLELSAIAFAGGMLDRARWRRPPHLWAAVARAPGACLCRFRHQHAAARADLSALLCPTCGGGSALSVRRGGHRHDHQCRGLFRRPGAAGFLSRARSEIEATEAMGMSKLQTVRYVILPHILRVSSHRSQISSC